MKTRKNTSALKAQYKKLEQVYNKESKALKSLYEISQERLITKSFIHDLATPLSSIQAAFLILEDSNNYVKTKEILYAGKASVNSAVKLLSSLNSNNLSNNRNQIFEVGQSIDNVIKILHSKGSKANIRITFETKGSCYIKAKKLTFERVLLNLVNNSIEELSSSSKLKKEIDINLHSQNDSIFILVKDNGNGITKNKIHQIFKEGYSSKKNHLGLGLAYVQKAVYNELAGTISISSVEGEYTEVFLKLKGFCKK